MLQESFCLIKIREIEILEEKTSVKILLLWKHQVKWTTTDQNYIVTR